MVQVDFILAKLKQRNHCSCWVVLLLCLHTWAIKCANIPPFRWTVIFFHYLFIDISYKSSVVALYYCYQSRPHQVNESLFSFTQEAWYSCIDQRRRLGTDGEWCVYVCVHDFARLSFLCLPLHFYIWILFINDFVIFCGMEEVSISSLFISFVHQSCLVVCWGKLVSASARNLKKHNQWRKKVDVLAAANDCRNLQIKPWFNVECLFSPDNSFMAWYKSNLEPLSG